MLINIAGRCECHILDERSDSLAGIVGRGLKRNRSDLIGKRKPPTPCSVHAVGSVNPCCSLQAPPVVPIHHSENVIGRSSHAPTSLVSLCLSPTSAHPSVSTGDPHSGHVPLTLPVRLYPHSWQWPGGCPTSFVRVADIKMPHTSTAATYPGDAGTSASGEGNQP